MSATDPADRGAARLRTVAGEVFDAYRHMEMPVRRSVALVLGPSALLTAGVAVAVLAVPLPTSVLVPLVALGALALPGALAHPKLVRGRRRKEIRERFHLFLTHVTILSLTNIDCIEVFRAIAAQETEYEAIATEMGRLVALVDAWNRSLEDACRLRARRVPSPLMREFLERLAYTVGAGQEMSDFLLSEQDAILQQFITRYENDLRRIEVMKELYLSMTLSTTFLLVFAVVLPILLDVDPTLAVVAVIGLFVVVQAGFVFLVHMISPYDLVWFHAESITPDHDRRIAAGLVGGGLLALALTAAVAGALFGVVPGGDAVPLPLSVAIPLTPLLLPGVIARREERRVRNRDDQFTGFVRALGSVEGVKQSSTSSVLADLRTKDFGALTGDVTRLYRRLNVRIDAERAWRLFAAETGSSLIQKFGDMYVVGRRMGGDPAELGRLISANMNEVLKLREQRRQAVSTVVGVIYGLTAASVFASFIGLEVVQLMMAMFESMEIDGSLAGSLLYTAAYDTRVIEFLLLCVVLVNALLSSLLVRVIDRGHYVSGLVHFVLLTWLGAVVGW